MSEGQRFARHADRAALVLALVVVCLFGWAGAGITGPADPYIENYQYDALGRLQSKTVDSKVLESYTYDPAGNRITKTIEGAAFTLEGPAELTSTEVATIKIKRSGDDLSAAHRIDVTVTDLTASAGSDYLYWMDAGDGTIYATSGNVLTVDFAANQTEQNLIIETYASAQVGESLTVGLSNPKVLSGGNYVNATKAGIPIPVETYAVGNGTSPTPGPATFAVTSSSVSVAEGGSATVTIKRSGVVSTAHDVAVMTLGGSATAGSDYTAVNQTLSFAANELVKTVSIPIATDATNEAHETFALAIVSATNGANIAASVTNIIITGTGSPATTVRVLDATVTEGGQTQVRFVRDGDASQPQQFYYNSHWGTATSADYTPNNSSQPLYSQLVGFSTNVRVIAATINATQDTVDEGEEYLIVYGTIGGSNSPNFSDPIARVTIVDDDGTTTGDIAPTSSVSFALSGNVSISEGQTGNVTITRTGDTASTHTVNFTVQMGTASEEYDMVMPVMRSVWFGPGETSKQIPFEALTDSITEGDEHVYVILSSVTNGATIASPEMATVTIPGNSPTTRLGSVRILDATVIEGGQTQVRFVRDGDASQSQQFYYNSHWGTATGADYTPSYTSQPLYSQLVGFSPNVRVISATISTTQDTAAEGDEHLIVYGTYGGSNSPNFSDPIARVTIVDDDGAALPNVAPTSPVSFALAGNVSISEGQTGNVTIMRTGDTASTHTVNFTLQAGTASEEYDMVMPFNTSVWFGPGETSKQIPFEALTDSISEADEHVYVILSSVTNGATIASPEMATVTIPGNPPTTRVGFVSIPDVTITEGTSGQVQFNRTGNPGIPQQFNYNSHWGTATAADYTPSISNQPLRTELVGISTNDTWIAVNITATQDSLVEGDEYFLVYATYGGFSSPNFSDPIARVTIVDDDIPGVFKVCNGAEVVVNEAAGTAAVSISRVSGTLPATINYNTVNDTAVAGSDYTSTSGSVSFTFGDNTSKTVNIPIANDNDVDPGSAGSEYFDFNITLASGTNGSLESSSCRIAIQDND